MRMRWVINPAAYSFRDQPIRDARPQRQQWHILQQQSLGFGIGGEARLDGGLSLSRQKRAIVSGIFVA